MTISVIQGSAVVLEQNVIYRARLEVVPPLGPVATEGTVGDELGKQGFANIRFYERDRLPVDWPSTEKGDDSGFMGKTYYLEGRFTLTARRIPLSELGDKVNLRSMWVYLVPTPVPVPGGGSPPPLPPSPPVPPSDPTPPDAGGAGLQMSVGQAKIAMATLVGIGAYWFTRRRLQHATRRTRR